MIMGRPDQQKGTAVPTFQEIPDDATASERTLTEALLDELNLKGRLPAGAVISPSAALDVARALIAGVTITAAAPAVSKPHTARELAALSASALADARKLALDKREQYAPLGHVLAAVAAEYRNLAAVVASNAALQPDTEGTN